MRSTNRVFKQAMSTVAAAALVAGVAISDFDADGVNLGGSAALAAPGNSGNAGNGGAPGNSGNAGNDGGAPGNSGNAGNDGGAPGNSGNVGNADADGAPGNSGAAPGHNKDDDGTAHASDLGRLNAAHASDQAKANASEESAVGQVASYERDILDGDIAEAANSLAEAANKDIVEPVVHALNDLLGIDDTEIGERDDGEAGETSGDNDGEVEVSDDGRLTVHDTEGEVVAQANKAFSNTDNDSDGADADMADTSDPDSDGFGNGRDG